MFDTANVKIHLPLATLKPERGEADDPTPMYQARLMVEPLTPALAKQLGPDVHDHCFSKGGRIRGEVTRLQMRLKLPAQAIEMRMGEDTHPSAVLRQVRLSQFTITKRGEPKEGTPTKKKQKKVGPQKETLRLTVTALIDAAEQTHRDFLADYIGSTFFMTFKSEAPGLPLGGTVPGTDSDAGDVLDEQPDLELKDEKKPRGKKGGRK